jgi:hypothetical protein
LISHINWHTFFSCFVIELDPGYRVYELDAGLWWLLFLLYRPVPHLPVKQLFDQSEFFNLQSCDSSNSVLVLFLGEWAELEFLGGNRCSSKQAFCSAGMGLEKVRRLKLLVTLDD